jgi:hypothetical protein
MASQFLTTRGPSLASEVVQSLGAVQAQDYSGAKWALGQRTHGGTDATIEREIDEGRILRTHVLRPTWHFVLPGDIRWMLALTAPRVEAATASYTRRLELDRKIFRRSNAVLTKALAGGECLTRTELKARLVRARVPVPTTQHLGHLMMQAELDGVVCSGPRRGKQFTYALLDERAPRAPSLTREEALLELTRRYFATRGPATPRDFAWWSGLTIADAKRGIALAGRELEVLTLGGQSFWTAADAPRPPRAARVVHLLPNYDEYFIGFRDRSAIAERLGHSKVVTGGDALVPHVITIGGQLVGTWRRAVEKTRVVVTLTLLTRLGEAERKAVHAAVERFGAFLGSAVDLHEQSSIIR